MWRNPRYNDKKIVNDVGLLKLEEPAEDVSLSPTLATSVDAGKVSAAKFFNLYGWGLNQNKKMASYLRTATLTNQNTAASKLLAKYGYSNKTMLAAGNYLSKEKIYAGACNGDSGGPLVARIAGGLKLVGVTSWGVSGCDKKTPTVFSNLTYFEKDISSGKQMLNASVTNQNRAVPKVQTEPSIDGEASVGSKLTCQPGVWSANTKSVEITWTSPPAISGITTSTIEVLQEDAGTTFTCKVVGYSDAASRTLEKSVKIPPRPSSNSPLTISGIQSIYPPLKVGDVAKCSGMIWNQPGVTETITWYVSETSTFSETNRTLGSGSSLNIDLATGTAIAGKYLQCLATGKSAGGTKGYYTSILVSKPASPIIFGVSISGLSSGTVPPTVGSTGTCSYTASEGGSEFYEWALTDNGYPAKTLEVLGTGKQLQISSDLVTKLSGKYLQCKVTLTGIGGTYSAKNYLWYLYSLPQVSR